MSKTIVSAFHSREEAARVLNSLTPSKIDSDFSSIIEPKEAASASRFKAVMSGLPSLQARIYREDLLEGDALLVARVAESDVARFIKLLQSTGGHHIEAFDHPALRRGASGGS
jgi:hypothetical protein